MADKPATPDGIATPPDPVAPPTTPPVPPKRGPGHRGADVKDTVAEMAAKAHEISLGAGSKMAAAMKDVINAAAGITGFVLESARDLVQYMVRRGQMTQEEADKLIRQAEEAQAVRRPGEKAASKAAEIEQQGDSKTADSAAKKSAEKPVEKVAEKSEKPAVKKSEKPAVAKSIEKPAEKPADRPADKAPAAKKAAVKAPAPAAKKAPAKKK